MNNNTVSFQENGHEIKDTYLKIINNSEDKLKWLIITNDDKNELFVEETGESLKDFVESLKDDSAKVRYGICKTIPPGSDVEKLLFIGYCSDSLPIKYKMAFMKNLQIVRDDLFSNYHVLMEIRDESDLSYEAISKKTCGSSVKLPQKVIPSKSFSKTPSASESFKKPSPLPKKASSPPQPVKAPSPAPVPAPKKPSPVPAPKKASPVPPVRKETVEPPKLSVPPAKEESDDEDGWSEPPLEEKEIGHKGSHTTSSWKPIGKVDLKKVIAEEKAKEDPRLVKEKSIPGFVAKRKIPTPEPEEVKVESEDEADLIEAEPVAEVVGIDDEKVQSEPEVVEIEDDEKDQSEPEVVKDEVKSEKEEAEIVKETSPEVKTESDRKADIEAYLSKMSKKSGTSSHGLKKAEVETKEATPEAKPPTLPSRSTNSVSSFTPEIIKPKPAVKTRASEEFDDEVKVSKSNIKKYGVPLPGLHVEEPEEVKSEKKEESDDGCAVPEPKKEETRAVPPPPPARAVPAPAVESEDEVVKAKALFDYEADESNEISFAKDEVLTNIEEKYPDWWYGTNEAGESGVFPSNYVEKI
ncbi:unnamed protein product [Hanseniaspora opuntiae]